MSDFTLFLVVLFFVTIFYGYVGSVGKGGGPVMAIMWVITGPLISGLIASLIKHYI